MDVQAAIGVIDEATAAIDEFHADYVKALHNESYSFDRSYDLEQLSLQPKLELARQVAQHVGAESAAIVAAPDKTMYNRRPYEANRTALVVLRTRLAEQERMSAILGPSGPTLATSSLHPTIWNAAAALFDGGHYRQAVQTAGQALEGHLQAISGPTLTGVDLGQLFGAPSGNGVRLHYDFLDPDGKTSTSAREGSASLIRGAMQAVRNLMSHPEWPEPTESEALEMLAVLSYVGHLADRATPLA